MDELINRITASVGIDPDIAKQAVGAILAFLEKEGPADKIEEMMGAFPGARELIALAPADGMLSMGGVMGLGSKLMGMGMGMGEISGVAKETIGFARENSSDETIDQIIASIPGLSQFV